MCEPDLAIRAAFINPRLPARLGSTQPLQHVRIEPDVDLLLPDIRWWAPAPAAYERVALEHLHAGEHVGSQLRGVVGIEYVRTSSRGCDSCQLMPAGRRSQAARATCSHRTECMIITVIKQRGSMPPEPWTVAATIGAIIKTKTPATI